jgi:hypothetical protein
MALRPKDVQQIVDERRHAGQPQPTTTEILEDGMAEAVEEIVPDHEPGQEQDAERVAAIFKRVALQQDMERVKVGAALMNVFNYAVQVQAGRNEWTHDDFRAFIVAHSAIDQIGKAHIHQQKKEQNDKHLRAVETEIARHERPPEQEPAPRRSRMPDHNYPAPPDRR